MALGIKVNGIEFGNFTQARVTADMGAVTRSFSFMATATPQTSFPIKVKDLVEITADGKVVLVGYIETSKLDYQADTYASSHIINVSGRSILADLVDSAVPTQTEFAAGETLISIAEKTMQGIGLKPVIVNNAGTIAPFDDLSSAEIGGNAFAFLEKYSRKRQVLLTTDGGEALVLARTSNVFAPSELRNIVPGSNSNNIKAASLTQDHSERYNTYSVRSQINPMRVSSGNSIYDIVDTSGVFVDSEIRSTRRLEFSAENPLDSEEANARALWEKNIRKAKSLSYEATVAGHTVDGTLWLPNTLVRVIDTFADINATLLIRGVVYEYDVKGGSTTQLSMTVKGAFTLEAEQAARDAATEEIGTKYVRSDEEEEEEY